MALERFVPILPVGDLAASLAFYARLGFTTSEYSGPGAAGGYGVARRDTAEVHLGTVNPGRPSSPATAYLHVRDADGLAAQWHAAGVEVGWPEDTPWGRREGVVVDPDGNVIRFGSAL